MKHSAVRILSLIAVLSLSACGGGGSSGGGSGGGGSTAPTPAAAVTLTSSATDAKQAGTVTLTWTSTNATSCAASGDWTGALSTSGSQSVTVSKTSTYNISCTGAGGTGTNAATIKSWAAPTVKLSTSDSNVLANNTVTLTWSSTDATACAISGLTGASGTAGSQVTEKLTATASYTATCTNAAFTGADAAKSTITVNVATTYSLTVAAKYESPGPSTATDTAGYALVNFDNPVTASIPYIWIELQKPDGTVVTGSYANSNGEVRFTNLDPGVKYIPVLQSKSLHDGFDLWVVNNRAPLSTSETTVRKRYAPYADKAREYAADTKLVEQSTSFIAKLGWDATTKTLDNTKRVSAPYAIIAAVNVVEEFGKKLSGGAAAAASPKYTVLWTTQNKGKSTSFIDDFDLGLVNGSGGYSATGYSAIDAAGKSTGARQIENIMFLSGDPASEIMEFGGVVSAHETWHFVQQTRFRDNNTGGSHASADYQDPRLVWGEGMATAIPLLVAKSSKLDRPYLFGGDYRSRTRDYSVGQSTFPVGWFQESIIPRLVWSLYDPAGTFKLTPETILAPMYTPEWANGIWPANLWAYGKLLKAANPNMATAMDTLAGSLKVTWAGTDEWANGETVTGNRTQTQTLPVFTRIAPGSKQTVCSAGAPNEYNKLGNSRFLKIIGDGKPHTYTVTGPTNTVPKIDLAGTSGDGRGWFVKGSKTFSLTGTVTHPSNFAFGVIRECVVTGSEDPANNSTCSDTSYTPPAEQCWTIEVTP